THVASAGANIHRVTRSGSLAPTSGPAIPLGTAWRAERGRRKRAISKRGFIIIRGMWLWEIEGESTPDLAKAPHTASVSAADAPRWDHARRKPPSMIASIPSALSMTSRYRAWRRIILGSVWDAIDNADEVDGIDESLRSPQIDTEQELAHTISCGIEPLCASFLRDMSRSRSP
ncbi:MAG: hypothetical protein ACI8W8_002986, partial [Rhodothermales bacterium]